MIIFQKGAGRYFEFANDSGDSYQKQRDDTEEYISFVKDEFAEKWSQTDELQHNHAENCWLADAEFLIREADFYSSSNLLYSICRNRPNIWTAEQKRTMIRSQLKRGNGHLAYARLLLQHDIFTEKQNSVN